MPCRAIVVLVTFCEFACSANAGTAMAEPSITRSSKSPSSRIFNNCESIYRYISNCKKTFNLWIRCIWQDFTKSILFQFAKPVNDYILQILMRQVTNDPICTKWQNLRNYIQMHRRKPSYQSHLPWYFVSGTGLSSVLYTHLRYLRKGYRFSVFIIIIIKMK